MPERLSFGDLTLDLPDRTVRRDGVNIDLTSREAILLEYLLRNQGQPISNLSIVQNMMELSFDFQKDFLNDAITGLRYKIDNGFKTKIIDALLP